MADGSVVIEASMNTSKAEQDLAELKAKIEKMEKSIKSDADSKTGLEANAKQMAVTLDAAKEKLYEMQMAAKGVYSKQEIVEQREYVKGLQQEWDGVMNAVDRYGKRIEASNTQLEGMKIQAGQMEAEIDEANAPMGRLQATMEESGKSAKKLLGRIKSLVMSALVFSVMTQGFNALKDWVGETIRANDEARASFARLQGALLTLVQPLVQDIARFFGVPLYKLQAGKQSYQSNEQNAIEYVVGTLHPNVSQWEELTWKLLPLSQSSRYKVRVNMMAELRGDHESRGNWYKAMREVGAFSVNDILALEDLPDVDGGDERYASLNYVPLSLWRELSISRNNNGGDKNAGNT